MSRPLILISNDDGYYAKGINDLVEMVRDFGDVLVVAPDGARSGASLSITSREPVRIRKIHEEDGLQIYSCTGSPCDCVKIAFEKLIDGRPDLILAGINHGDNAAVNAHYSGTMAVATEGTLKRVPSIGLSSCKLEADADFSAMRPYVRSLVEDVLNTGLPKDVCLNVNFPALEEFKGMKICRMGTGDWVNEWDERIDPRGRSYFWLTGDFVGYDEEDESTDRGAMNNGYVAITPIQLDCTAYSVMEELRQKLGLS